MTATYHVRDNPNNPFARYQVVRTAEGIEQVVVAHNYLDSAEESADAEAYFQGGVYLPRNRSDFVDTVFSPPPRPGRRVAKCLLGL